MNLYIISCLTIVRRKKLSFCGFDGGGGDLYTDSFRIKVIVVMIK